MARPNFISAALNKFAFKSILSVFHRLARKFRACAFTLDWYCRITHLLPITAGNLVCFSLWLMVSSAMKQKTYSKQKNRLPSSSMKLGPDNTCNYIANPILVSFTCNTWPGQLHNHDSLWAKKIVVSQTNTLALLEYWLTDSLKECTTWLKWQDLWLLQGLPAVLVSCAWLCLGGCILVNLI